MPAKKTENSNSLLDFNKKDIMELAKSAPDLAAKIYHTQQNAAAQQAFTKFQTQLKPVSKNGSTSMYDYVHFDDLKKTVNQAMQGTGLTWHQYAHKGPIVTIPLLDNHNKPSFVSDYQHTHKVQVGWGRKRHNVDVPNPLTNNDGNAMPIYTKGQQVLVTTVISYKNGIQLAHGEMSTVSQSTDPQDIGSATTYCRRYSLSLATGASSVPDDDGQQNGGGRSFGRSSSRNFSSNYISQAQLSTLNDLINKSAKAKGADASAVKNYVNQTYANGYGLNRMFASQFGKAQNFLKAQIK